MGIDTSDEAGWLRNKGLRIIGGGMRARAALARAGRASPTTAWSAPRLDFDELLARHAQKAGARLHEQTQRHRPGPRRAHRPGRRRHGRDRGRRRARRHLHRARSSSPPTATPAGFSLALGLHRRDDRPMGVAVPPLLHARPRHDDDWLESWLELWDGDAGEDRLLPGYGWIFGMGDGTSNVGLGILNTSAASATSTTASCSSAGWRPCPRSGASTRRTRAARSAAPRCRWASTASRTTTRGVLLVGDAGGMVNPFNGEGIAYAMESGRDRRRGHRAGARPSRTAGRASGPCTATRRRSRTRYGGYYTLGRVFVKLIGNPRSCELATRHGLPHPTLMRFTLKLLANLTDPRGGDAMDRIINGTHPVAPAA